MEEQIKHIAKSQRIVYVIFWAVAILLVVGGETELLPVGLLPMMCEPPIILRR